MILDILNELAADNSRLAKEAILRREMNNETLKRVFKAAYDPTINYWIKKIPVYTTGELLYTLDQALSMLDDISQRTFTGNVAIEQLEHILTSVASQDAEVISRVIERDLKCATTDSTANKIWKGLIPEFSYMRCALPKAVKLDKWNWSEGIYSQEKADGMFCNIDVYADGEVVLTTRAGTVIPTDNLGYIVNAAKTLLTKNTRTHGEFLVLEKDKVLPREIGNGIMSSIAKGGDFKNVNQRAVLLVWDQIPLSNAMSGEEYKKTYSTRLNSLQAQVANLGITDSIRIIPSKVVRSYKEAMEHYAEMLEAGKEGTIIKTQTGTWKDTTSKEQVKLKLEIDVDLEIIELTEGKGKNADLFGSIKCRTRDGLLEVDVSGFKDDERVRITKEWKTIKGKIMVVRGNSLMKPTGNKMTWSIFLPRHVEIRYDKKVADSLEQVIAQFESAVKL